MLARLAGTVDLIRYRPQPGPAVLVGQGSAGAHLGDVAGRVKSVAILESPVQAFGQLIRDGALAGAGYAHHDQRAGYFDGFIAHENSPATRPCRQAKSSRRSNRRDPRAG